MARGDTVTFEDCKLVAISSKDAILVHNDEWDEDCWFPEGHVDDDSELHHASKRGDTGKIVVTRWIAKQRGLVD